ncbi:hypothetical protein V6U90_17600 [Micromonospora sp. CPCC 206060]|uniref:hypothetical protein n=1 Tax=Micromonospora sp. CPCC 206060 TaxID=3122406 RepID=UPI002FEFAAD9
MTTPVAPGPGTGRYATGQLLALVLVALLALPLLPLLALVVAWIRLRDRRREAPGRSVGDP